MCGCSKELTRKVTFLTHHSHGELIIDYVSFERARTQFQKSLLSHMLQPSPLRDSLPNETKLTYTFIAFKWSNKFRVVVLFKTQFVFRLRSQDCGNKVDEEIFISIPRRCGSASTRGAQEVFLGRVVASAAWEKKIR